MSDTPNKHWLSPYERDDGLTISRSDDATAYVIITADKNTLNLCPCCTMPFKTPRSAQTVADIAFPVAPLPPIRAANNY